LADELLFLLIGMDHQVAVGDEGENGVETIYHKGNGMPSLVLARRVGNFNRKFS
jgi:hypothetical protein